MRISSRRRNPKNGPMWLVAAILATLSNAACGSPTPPDPMSADTAEARTGQAEQMAGALDEVVAVLGGEVVGESTVDECYEGQRGWKRDTGYDHRCSLRVGVLVGLDGDFRTLMLETDEALQRLDWRAADGEWPGKLVDEYWDLRRAESFGERVRVDRLPSPHSVRRDGLRLLFDYGSVHDDRGLERIDRSQQTTAWCCGSPFFERSDLIDVDRVAERVSHQHLVLVSVEGHYLEE